MRLRQEDAYSYLLSGRATVTFHNVLTNNQYTYRILQKIDDGKAYPLWFVLCNRKYLGYIRSDVFIKSDEVLMDRVIEVFAYMWRKIISQQVPDNVHILHDGTCGRCARQLTDADSIRVGIGPECRKKLGITIKQHDTTRN